MVDYTPEAGMRGLKQIWKKLEMRQDLTNGEKKDIFAKHTHNFLQRCFPDWCRGEQK